MKKENILNLVKKVFNKTVYIIEYIISLVLINEIFGIVTTKIYNGYQIEDSYNGTKVHPFACNFNHYCPYKNR